MLLGFYVMESCVPGLTGVLFFLFPLNKNYNLLFALPCPPVCQPEAMGVVYFDQHLVSAHEGSFWGIFQDLISKVNF